MVAPLRSSLRLRLTLWYTAALTAALLAYAALAFAFLDHRLNADLDVQLDQDLTMSAAMLDVEDGRIGWGEDDPPPTSPEARPWVEVLAADGRRLLASPALEAARHGGEPLRWMSRQLMIDGTSVTLRAARPVAPLRHELVEFAIGLLLGLPLAVGLAGAIGYLLARRALAPIGRMADAARAVTLDRLDARLDSPNPDDELGRMAGAFNATFERLETSVAQLRRFTADASHELRTPLTALRSVGEVGLRMERSPQAYREIIASMLEESERLAALIENLLTLSRADGGQLRLDRVALDPAVLVEEVAARLEPLADEKAQTLERRLEPSPSLSADPVVLRQVLTNLIDNAIKYTPEGGRIVLTLREADGGLEIGVADSGPGIPPTERDRVFERFYRIDKARSRELGGTGLGLAIARWGVAAHGGRIGVSDAPEGGALFRIFLPRE